MFGGNVHSGCYFLAVCIFSAGILRDTLFVSPFYPHSSISLTLPPPYYSYSNALKSQPHHALLPAPLNVLLPAVLFLCGQTFVVTSTWALGITGTFLGDYFGILMDHRVEGFPFNVLRDPMYIGSTMCFAAGALW